MTVGRVKAPGLLPWRSQLFPLQQIYHRIPNSDPSSSKTRQIISTIRTQNLPNCQLISRSHYSPLYLSFVMLLAALSWQYLSTLTQVTEDYVQTGEH